MSCQLGEQSESKLGSLSEPLTPQGRSTAPGKGFRLALAAQPVGAAKREEGAQLGHHTAPTCSTMMTSGGYQNLKNQRPLFLQMRLRWAQGTACVQGPASLPIAHKGCGCHAGQTECVAQLSSFAAALITHNCSLLGLEILWPNPVDLLACLMFLPVHPPLRPEFSLGLEEILRKH